MIHATKFMRCVSKIIVHVASSIVLVPIFMCLVFQIIVYAPDFICKESKMHNNSIFISCLNLIYFGNS